MKIREFPIHKMEPNSKILIIGKPGTGKSTLIKDIYYHSKHQFPVTMVVSGTESDNHFYREFIPESFIYEDYEDGGEEAVERFVERQRKHAKKGHIQVPWALLTIDDCTDNSKLFGKKLWQSIYKLGRHWKLRLILSLQYCLDLTTSVRQSTDYIFIMNERMEETRKKLHKTYATPVGTFADFNQVMDQVAMNYTALVIDNRSQKNNDASETVYFYKAQTHDGFKFGAPEIWQWDKDRYDKNWEEKQAD